MSVFKDDQTTYTGNVDILGNLTVHGLLNEVNTSGTTYYVRTDGSDRNSGLSDDAAGAFLTVQHAVDVVSGSNTGIGNVTIQIRAGTYAGANIFGPVLVKGVFLITGDTTTPSNVVITAASTGNAFGVFRGASVQFSGLALTTPGFACLQVGDAGIVELVDKMDFGSCLYHLEAQNGGFLSAAGITYSISGTPTAAHVRANNLGFIDTSFSIVNLLANITTTQFVISEISALYKATNMTFNLGAFAVTGSKYTVRNNAVINTNTANVNYFPGSTPGTGTNSGVAPWGLYL